MRQVAGKRKTLVMRGSSSAGATEWRITKDVPAPQPQTPAQPPLATIDPLEQWRKKWERVALIILAVMIASQIAAFILLWTLL